MISHWALVRTRYRSRPSGTHAQQATIGEAIVVLVQAWDDSRGRVLHDLSVSRGDRLVPLRVVDKSGKAVELTGTSPFSLSTKDAHVVLARKRIDQVDAEVDAGPALRPEPGMRVRLDGHAGSVVREDAGLWVVKMDTPVDGMSELTVARDAMTRLVKLPMSRAIEEQLRCTLSEDGLVLASKHQEPWKEGISK